MKLFSNVFNRYRLMKVLTQQTKRGNLATHIHQSVYPSFRIDMLTAMSIGPESKMIQVPGLVRHVAF